MTGGGNATTGGTSVLSTADLASFTQACIAYVTAQCTRRSQCDSSQSYQSCMENQMRCPAIFLGPGTGYTLETLNSCAPQWATVSCADVNSGKHPSCTQPGTRAAGQGCRFSTQCSSGICSAPNPATCGQCVNPSLSGDACVTQYQCPSSYLCSFGRCQQLQAESPDTALPNGSPCNYEGSCSGSCAPSTQGNTCVSAPSYGQACLSGLPAGARNCQWRLICSNGTCVSPAGTGTACTDATVPCYASYCDSPNGLAPGTCTAWHNPGDACNRAVLEMCGENDTCMCDDAACSNAHCVRYVMTGGTCDDYTRCSAGTTCTNGTCAATNLPYWPDDCS